MILKGNLFENEKTQKMFENENFSSKELKILWSGREIESRKHEKIKYILHNGKIKILETR